MFYSYSNPKSKLIRISHHNVLSEDVKYYKKIKAQGVQIIGYSKIASPASFLTNIVAHFPQALEVDIQGKYFDKKGGSWEALKDFKDIKCLVIVYQEENKYPFIDFSWFPNLEMLFIDSFKNTINFEKSNIQFVNYLHNGLDLVDFTPPQTMTSLCLVGNVKSLRGIEKIQQLQRLTLRVLKNVKDLSWLDTLPHLVCLEMRLCTKIDYEHFTVNPHITYLELELLDTKAKFPSIQFLNKLPNVERVGISGDVADGDMTPLLNIPNLKKCWFQNKKKYSHTLEEIWALKNVEMFYVGYD